MSGTASLLAVFGLGMASGYLLRGATRFSMSADEVAWGWGYKRGRRRRSRRDPRPQGVVALASGPSGSSSIAIPHLEVSGAVRGRASRLPFLAGLTTGAAFAAAYVLLGSRPEAFSWIGLSLLDAAPVLERLAHWSGS